MLDRNNEASSISKIYEDKLSQVVLSVSCSFSNNPVDTQIEIISSKTSVPPAQPLRNCSTSPVRDEES